MTPPILRILKSFPAARGGRYGAEAGFGVEAGHVALPAWGVAANFTRVPGLPPSPVYVVVPPDGIPGPFRGAPRFSDTARSRRFSSIEA